MRTALLFNFFHRIKLFPIINRNEIQQQESLFRSLLENSQEMISLIDEEGRVLFQSPSVQQIMGYSAGECKGRYIHEHIHPSDRGIAQSLLQRALGLPGITMTMQVRLQKKNQTYIQVESRLTNRLHVAGVRALVVNERDVTEQWILRDEIQQLNTALEKRVVLRTRELEIANAELEAFSYSVSHDLRAPLRAISGFATILEEDYSDVIGTEGRRIIGVIRSNAAMMGQLIDDLLRFSRVGRMTAVNSSIDMEQVVDSCVELLLPGEQKEKYRFVIHPLGICQGDAGMIRHVWLNLLDNAIKYSCRREEPVIEIGCTEEPDKQVYFIKDNGAGFDMAYSEKLFGVFQRLHSHEDFVGTGVGLALVQRIIHKHRGEVRAEGAVDKGACFYFSLPKK